MKTNEQIDKEAKEINQYISDNLASMKDAKLMRLKNRLEYLSDMKKYLSFNPSEIFLKQEQERLTKLIAAGNDKFEYWCKNVADKNLDPKKWRSSYNSETGISKNKKRLKTIEFLLA